MTKKVLFTASTFSHILNFHLPYLRWFKEKGWLVHAACGGAPAEVPYADKVIALPLQKKMTAPDNFRAAAQLRRLISAEKYDLISTHTSLAAFFTRLAAKRLPERPPLINIVHGYLFDADTPAARRRLLLAAERFTAPETDLLLTMNAWDNRLAEQEKLGRRVAQIPGMGVDFAALGQFGREDGLALRRRWQIPADAFVLLYPAEFSARKNQALLLRALTLLPESCVLALPGQGALLEECRALAAKLGLSGRVVFPGQITKMGEWYAMADAAVSASRSEGLPFNIMEAMYCGLPVVASAVKGHIDLIRNGETGCLYPYGDAAACAEAVRRLLSSNELRRKLGSRAREAARQYSLENVLPQVVRWYGELAPELAAAATE